MQRKRSISGALVAALFATALARPADAQVKISQELMASSDAGEKAVTRTIGNMDMGQYHVWGMLDAAHGSRRYFGKLSLHKEARGRWEQVFELEKGNGDPAKIGTGVGYDMPMPKGAYLNVHVLPFGAEVNAKPGQGLLREIDIDAFGGYERKGFYMEGMMHASLPYGTGKKEYAGEISAGKKINSRFAGQVTLAHYGSASARADLKCKIR